MIYTFHFLLIVLVCITSLVSTYYVFQMQKFDYYWKEISTTCEIEANCKRFHTCVGGDCLQFYPNNTPTNQTKCHQKCKYDLRLYEEKYYRRAIGNIIFFKGVDSDHCLIAYKHTGVSENYEDPYPKYYLENIKRRVESKGWLLGLCIWPTD